MTEEKKAQTSAEAQAAEEQADAAAEEQAQKASAAGEEEAEAASEASEEDSSAAGEETAAESSEKADEEAAEKAESERYMRLMAEFQNYKKRVAKEKSDIHAFANEKLIVSMLTVLDNFERALAADPAADPEAYGKGMELIFGQLKDLLKKEGLEEVECLGEEFDPEKHNAVMTEETEEYESGHVSKVLQKGYRLGEKVVRPSMVTVAK